MVSALKNRNAGHITPREIYQIPYQLVLDDSEMHESLTCEALNITCSTAVSGKAAISNALTRHIIIPTCFLTLNTQLTGECNKHARSIDQRIAFTQRVKKPTTVA